MSSLGGLKNGSFVVVCSKERPSSREPLFGHLQPAVLLLLLHKNGVLLFVGHRFAVQSILPHTRLPPLLRLDSTHTRTRDSGPFLLLGGRSKKSARLGSPS